jgi:glycyl-tRNA synthetase (class II)
MVDMDKLVALCTNRGFIYPSSEIYGGINGFWDYGPLGVELRNNVKAAWWQSMVRERSDIVGLDSSIIANPETWVASGHVANFHDRVTWPTSTTRWSTAGSARSASGRTRSKRTTSAPRRETAGTT